MVFRAGLSILLSLATLTLWSGSFRAQQPGSTPGLAVALQNAIAEKMRLPEGWQHLGVGFQRLDVRTPGIGDLTALRLSPRNYSALVIEQRAPQGSTAEAILALSEATVVVNGGYFDTDANGTKSPTGLLIADGHLRAPLRSCRACSGVLLVSSRGLEIAWARDVKDIASYDAAIQAGPMLVEPGGLIGIRSPDNQKAARTAVCIQAVTNNIVVVLVSGQITLYDLAALLRDDIEHGGLACERAINLDGGPSSQMAIRRTGSRAQTTDVRSDQGAEFVGTPSAVQNFLAFIQVVR